MDYSSWSFFKQMEAEKRRKDVAKLIALIIAYFVISPLFLMWFWNGWLIGVTNAPVRGINFWQALGGYFLITVILRVEFE